MDNLIKPKAIFSVVWKPYLYYVATSSVTMVIRKAERASTARTYLFSQVLGLCRHWPVIDDGRMASNNALRTSYRSTIEQLRGRPEPVLRTGQEHHVKAKDKDLGRISV